MRLPLIPRANGFAHSHTQKSQCIGAEWQTWWRHSITKRQTFSAAASRQSWACKALPAPRSKRELRLRRRMQFDVHLAARLVSMTWMGTPVTMAWADRYVGLGSWDSAWCRSVGLQLRLAPMTSRVGCRGWKNECCHVCTMRLGINGMMLGTADVVFAFHSPAPHICCTYWIHVRGVVSDTPGNIRCVTSVHAEAQGSPIA